MIFQFQHAHPIGQSIGLPNFCLEYLYRIIELSLWWVPQNAKVYLTILTFDLKSLCNTLNTEANLLSNWLLAKYRTCLGRWGRWGHQGQNESSDCRWTGHNEIILTHVFSNTRSEIYDIFKEMCAVNLFIQKVPVWVKHKNFQSSISQNVRCSKSRP